MGGGEGAGWWMRRRRRCCSSALERGRGNEMKGECVGGAGGEGEAWWGCLVVLSKDIRLEGLSFDWIRDSMCVLVSCELIVIGQSIK